MSLKKILIISGSFYPQNSPRSFRTTELAKEYSRLGHEVVVYIPNKSEIHEQFEIDYGVEINNLGKRYKDINTNTRFKALSILKRLFRRLLLVLFAFPNVILMFQTKRILKNEKRFFDLLISIAVPHQIHWGVAWEYRNENWLAKKWIADCGDPFMGVKYDRFKKPYYFNFFENSFLKKADFVSIPFQDLVHSFNKKYHDKFIVIPQGFNFSEIKLSKSAFKNEVPTMIFAGTVMPGIRDPFGLIDFLIENKEPFKIIIYTRQNFLFKKYDNNKAIILKDYVMRLNLLEEMSKADFLINVNIDKNYNSSLDAIPSKLIDYALTGRPILSYEQNSFNKNKVKEFLKGNYTNQFKVKNIEKYNIVNVCNHFLTKL